MDSSVDGFSQEQSPNCGFLPFDLPATVTPSSPETSCGDSMEHASIGLAAREVPPAPPAEVLPGALWPVPCDWQPASAQPSVVAAIRRLIFAVMGTPDAC